MYFQKDTTEQTRDGGIVTFNLDSGRVVRVGNDSDDKVIGIVRRNDTLADSALVPVEVPVENAVEWLIDLDSDGGAADSDVGKLVNIDTVGGASVNAGDSAGMRVDISDSLAGCIVVTSIVSATRITGVIAGNLAFAQEFDTI
jgi:hypothetical protein